MHAYFHARAHLGPGRLPLLPLGAARRRRERVHRQFDAEGYYGNVREVLDLIDEHMEPGPLRDRVRSHWYRGKMLGRVGGRGFVKRRPEFRRRLYEEIRALALERYDRRRPRVAVVQPALRSQLLRAGRYEALEALSRWESTLQADVTTLQARSRDGGVVVKVEARMRDEHGPVAFERRGERSSVGAARRARRRVPARGARRDRRARGAATWTCSSPTSPADRSTWCRPREIRLEPIEGRPDHVAVVVQGEAFVDPERAAAEAKLGRGEWEVGAAMWTTGFAAPRTEVLRRGEPLRLLVTPRRPPGPARLAARAAGAPPGRRAGGRARARPAHAGPSGGVGRRALAGRDR